VKPLAKSLGAPALFGIVQGGMYEDLRDENGEPVLDENGKVLWQYRAGKGTLYEGGVRVAAFATRSTLVRRITSTVTLNSL
jgi:queuine/archaeosine tRNA-ribosyltransferase